VKKKREKRFTMESGTVMPMGTPYNNLGYKGQRTKKVKGPASKVSRKKRPSRKLWNNCLRERETP